jgi:hypothetical protein
MEENRRRIEPFCLFGNDSIIYTKEEAAKVVMDNSYYFMIAGCLILVLLFFALLGKRVPGESIQYLIIMATLYLSLTLALRKLKSRVAAISILMIVVWALLPRLIQFDIGWSFIFNLLFLAAATRSVKATFFFHKKQI